MKKVKKTKSYSNMEEKSKATYPSRYSEGDNEKKIVGKDIKPTYATRYTE